VNFTFILQDDEYAVYSTSQQRIRYLVEFTVRGDLPPMERIISDLATTTEVECNSKEPQQKG